jgi:prepilin-type N-terminal cleavage/methylation domain-containing protein
MKGIFRRFTKGKKGFTLVEVLIALAILTLITGALSTSVIQIFAINRLSQNETVAMRQVQNLGSWMSRDIQMSKFRVPTPGTGFPLTLDWDHSIQGGDKHTVIYTLVGSKVIRSDYINNNPAPQIITVADFVTSISFSSTNDLVVTATVGHSSAFRVYQITPRVG